MCKHETYCETYYLIVRLTDIRNSERNSDRNETYKTFSAISQNLLFNLLVWICTYKILIRSYLCLKGQVGERKMRNKGVTVDSECISLIFVVNVPGNDDATDKSNQMFFAVCSVSFMHVCLAGRLYPHSRDSLCLCFCFIVWICKGSAALKISSWKPC